MDSKKNNYNKNNQYKKYIKEINDYFHFRMNELKRYSVNDDVLLSINEGYRHLLSRRENIPTKEDIDNLFILKFPEK